MDLIIEKIKKIQNKCQSLQWGHHAMSDDEVMFVVGNKAYPKMLHYFTVTSDKIICLLGDSHKRQIHKQCRDIDEVTATVISLLKEWFPAK